MKVYLAGPMRGFPRFNFDTFATATAWLRADGYDVVSPAELDIAEGFDPDGTLGGQGFDLGAAYARDLDVIREVEGIVLLPGWPRSSGARIEVLTADSLGKELYEMRRPSAIGAMRTDDEWECRDLSSAEMLISIAEQIPVAYDPEDEPVEDTPPEEGGLKDVKLARLDCVPPAGLWEVSEIFGYGAHKYGDDNWITGPGSNPRSVYAAALRHILSYRAGETTDPESGKPHLAHAITELFFLMELERTGRLDPAEFAGPFAATLRSDMTDKQNLRGEENEL